MFKKTNFDIVTFEQNFAVFQQPRLPTLAGFSRTRKTFCDTDGPPAGSKLLGTAVGAGRWTASSVLATQSCRRLHI